MGRMIRKNETLVVDNNSKLQNKEKEKEEAVKDREYENNSQGDDIPKDCETENKKKKPKQKVKRRSCPAAENSENTVKVEQEAEKKENPELLSNASKMKNPDSKEAVCEEKEENPKKVKRRSFPEGESLVETSHRRRSQAREDCGVKV